MMMTYRGLRHQLANLSNWHKMMATYLMQVILSDGDESSLANMKYNLELNQLRPKANMSQRTYVSSS